MVPIHQQVHVSAQTFAFPNLPKVVPVLQHETPRAFSKLFAFNFIKDLEDLYMKHY